jgi:hypothetical protein
MVATAPALSRVPQPLIDVNTRQKPRTVDLLNDWQYVERSVHRLLAAWGRRVRAWDDKSAWHRFVWDQAEIVKRLRVRVAEFPGGKPDAAVSARLEEVVNTVLLAPNVEDAIDGIFCLLLQCQVSAYAEYSSNTHPVHDAPTLAVLHEINQLKSTQWMWYRDYRRRQPHTTTESYAASVGAALRAVGEFRQPVPVGGGSAARPAGVGTPFRLVKFSARDLPTRGKGDFMPYVRADFRTNLEARRLFWAYGYLLEKNLPESQLQWIYDGHYMPWDWHYDISRHLWDESRHGDSGYSRLKDFGIDPAEVGFPSYNNDERLKHLDELAKGEATAEMTRVHIDHRVDDIPAEPMTPKDLYDAVFFIGMIAENGHFIVKNEAYADFRDGHDLESAEMMLFDIIDETAHVQYAHRWLPLLAEKAGVSNEGYREKAASIRAELERGELKRVAENPLPRDLANPDYAFYQELLARIRAVKPLPNAAHCPPRSPKPM